MDIEKLKQVIDSLGITLSEIEAVGNVSRRAIQKWFSGENQPQPAKYYTVLNTVLAIANQRQQQQLEAYEVLKEMLE